jgi:serine/threonine protein kinase
LATALIKGNTCHCQNNAPLKWDLRVNIALDLARGLEYLHDGAVPPVIHRDIKSPNILLDQSMHATVADFGLSREETVTRNGANLRGSYGYLDPVYVSSRSFTTKSDVYSYGVLLLEPLAGRIPQQGLMEYVELGRTGLGDYTEASWILEEVKQLEVSRWILEEMSAYQLSRWILEEVKQLEVSGAISPYD